MVDMKVYNEIEFAIKNMSKNIGDSKTYKTIINSLIKYYSLLESGKVKKANQKFKNELFKYNKIGGNKIDENTDIALELLDMIYRYSINLAINHQTEVSRVRSIADDVGSFISEYQKFGDGYNIAKIKNNVYKKPSVVYTLANSLSYMLPGFVESVKSGMIDSAIYKYGNYKERFEKAKETNRESVAPKKRESSIVFKSVTATARERLSNATAKYELFPSFYATYKDGSVEVSSIIGRKNEQQDAVLSLQKDGCAIHVVADGVGGANNSNVASAFTVNELGSWFDSLDLKSLSKPSKTREEQKRIEKALAEKLTKKLNEINTAIHDNGKDIGQTTVVLLITTPNFGMVANVGDSTLYQVDKNNRIDLVSKIDAHPLIDKEIVDNYELYRNHPHNNFISASLGQSRAVDPHIRVIDLKPIKKVLLSSDGITDLINAENFTNMILGNSTAKDFTDKSLYPDAHYPISPEYPAGTKLADNASAIIVHLDDEKKKGRRM